MLFPSACIGVDNEKCVLLESVNLEREREKFQGPAVQRGEKVVGNFVRKSCGFVSVVWEGK